MHVCVRLRGWALAQARTLSQSLQTRLNKNEQKIRDLFSYDFLLGRPSTSTHFIDTRKNPPASCVRLWSVPVDSSPRLLVLSTAFYDLVREFSVDLAPLDAVLLAGAVQMDGEDVAVLTFVLVVAILADILDLQKLPLPVGLDPAESVGQRKHLGAQGGARFVIAT